MPTTFQDRVDVAREKGLEITVSRLGADWHECFCGDESKSFTAASVQQGDFEKWAEGLLSSESKSEEYDLSKSICQADEECDFVTSAQNIKRAMKAHYDRKH